MSDEENSDSADRAAEELSDAAPDEVAAGVAVAGAATGAIGAAAHAAQTGDVAQGVVGAAGAAASAIPGSSDAARGVAAAGAAVAGVAGVAGAAARGDVAGAVTSGVQGAATAAAAALPAGTASDVARGVAGGAALLSGAASVAQSLQGNDAGALGNAASGATDASRYIVPESEVASVLGDGSEEGLARGAGGAASEALGGAREAVDYDLEVSDTGGQWHVGQVTISEGLNRVSSCVVEAQHADPPEAGELLLRECALRMTRGEQQRSFKGIVWHARVHEDRDGFEVELHIVSALQLLSQRSRSRIFQGQTIPEVFEQVYSEALGGLRRSIQNRLHATYEPREYIVQYQESELAFLNRLAEEEGFFWYFDHEGAREVLTLADSTAGLPRARDAHDGRVDHAHGATGGGEHAWGLHHSQRVGATDAVVSGYDWTHPRLPLLDAEQAGRGEGEPALEVYDHTDSVSLHQFDGEQYRHNTATVQGQIRADLLDLGRQSWGMESSVLAVGPGHLLEVVGCEDASLDQRYLILSVTAHGGSSGQGTGECSNSMRLVPASMSYRPARRTPRPTVHGLETATVVGDGEIHTDLHGRIRVHFHWDREHEATETESSCWMRVMHNWAGPGFGVFFLPRVGMEVVVGFLGGNPDQPIITGCLYNGDNRAGVEPDVKPTQSLIRTKSSPESANETGYNEMRFEDEAGHEFISVHAEKDYNEVVENNHSTTVHANQTNTVDVDQTEHVKGEQSMTVDKNRTVHIQGSQDVTIDGGEANNGVTGSKLEITGDYKVDVSNWIEIQAPTHIRLTCEGSSIEMTPGKIVFKAGDGAAIVLDANAMTRSKDGTEVLLDADARMTASTGAEVILTGDADMHSIAGSQVLLDVGAKMVSSKAAMVELTSNANMSGIAANVTGNVEAEMSAPTAKLAGAAGSVEAAAAGVDVAGPVVNVTGDSAVNVSGSVVKIN